MVWRGRLLAIIGAAVVLASCGTPTTVPAVRGELIQVIRAATPVPVRSTDPQLPPVVRASVESAPPTPVPAPPPPAPVVRSTAALSQAIDALAAEFGADLGVTLVELGGNQPIAFRINGGRQFTAASTYKLPLLMLTAQQVTSGRVSADRQICFDDSEFEDGWFDDYAAGTCLSVAELAMRAGHYSDNTAAHMLVDDLGGSEALNAYASLHGATNSEFFDPNLTTADDLAALLVNLANGQAGGAAAQQWLYPLLTDTAYEEGIPTGVGAGVTVVHKIGDIDSTLNDAALVRGGTHGDYVLVVMTDGPGIDGGWPLIAGISQAVWNFEAARS